jgi:hypothetical protein
MLCLCPRGQENNTFLNCLFLNKLPKELRILLLEADMADKQALGARADLFAAHNHKQAHDVVAVVAAVSLLERKPQWRRFALEPAVESTAAGAVSEVVAGGARRSLECGGGSGSREQVSHMVSLPEQARQETGLCFSHFCYGAKARTCHAPCTW